MPITEEKKLYLKEYRQRNKKHIAKVSQAKYLRTREDSIAKSRKWQEENKDKMNLRFRKWRKDNTELSRLRGKTKYTVREVKKKSNSKSKKIITQIDPTYKCMCPLLSNRISEMKKVTSYFSNYKSPLKQQCLPGSLSKYIKLDKLLGKGSF